MVRAMRLPFGWLVCVALVSAGCGDDAAGSGSGTAAGSRANAGSGSAKTGTGGKSAATKSSGMMRAKIDGKAWEAVTVRSKLDSKVPGGYTLEGTRAQETTQLSLSLYYVAATGDYVIGVDASVIGARGVYTTGSMAFVSHSNGVAG